MVCMEGRPSILERRARNIGISLYILWGLRIEGLRLLISRLKLGENVGGEADVDASER